MTRFKKGLSVVVQMGDAEARSRLSSVHDVCEYEAQALDGLGDVRLSRVLEAMSTLHDEIVAALATLAPDAINGGASSPQ